MSLSVQLMFKFPHHIIMSLAAVMAAFGIASITLAIMSLTFGVWGNYWGTGIWCGTVVFIGGLNGVVATHFKNSCCIKSYLILSIIGAVTSLAMLALSAGGLDYSSGFYKIHHDHSHNDLRTKVIYGCSLGCAIVQLVLCVASTGVCTYFIFIDKETVSFPVVKKLKNGHHKRNAGIRNSQTSISSRSPLVSKNKSEAQNVRKTNRTCADIAENRNEVSLVSRGRHSQRKTSRRSNTSERNQSDVNDRSCGRPPTFSTFGHMPEDENARNCNNTAEVIEFVPVESQPSQAQAPEASRINSLVCLWEPTLPIEEDEELPPYEESKVEDHCDLYVGSQPQCEDHELSSSSSESNISPLHRTHKPTPSQKAQDEITHTDLNENLNKQHSYTCRISDGRMTVSGLEHDENIEHYGIHVPSSSSQRSKDALGQLQRSVTLSSPYIHRCDKQPVLYNHGRHPQLLSCHNFKRDGDQIGFQESRKAPVRSQSLRLPLEHHHHYFKVPSDQNLDKISEVNARNSFSAQGIESLRATQGSWKTRSNNPFPQKHSAKQALIEVPLHSSSFLTFKYSLPVKSDVSEPKPPRLNPLSRCTDIIKHDVPQDANLVELNTEHESDQSMKNHLPLNIVGKSLSQNTDKVFKQNTAELQGNKIDKDYINCDNYYKTKETNKMGIFNKDKSKDSDETQEARNQLDPYRSVINRESSQIQTKDNSMSDQIHINSKQGGVKQVSLDQTLSRSSPLSPTLSSIPKPCVTLPRHSSTSLFKPVHQHSHQEGLSPIPTQFHVIPMSVAQESGRKSDYGMSSTPQVLKEPFALFAGDDKAVDSSAFEKDSSHQKLKQHLDMEHIRSKENRVQHNESHPEKIQRPERIQSFQNVVYESCNVSPLADSSASCSTSYSLEGTKDLHEFSTAGLYPWLRESDDPHKVRNFNGARPKTTRITNSKDMPVLVHAGKSYFSSNKRTNQKNDVTENTLVHPQVNLSAHVVIGRPLSKEEFLSSQSQKGDLKVRIPVHCEGRISAPPSIVRQNSTPLDQTIEPTQNSGSPQFTTGISDRFSNHASAGSYNPSQGVLLLRRQQSYQESVNRQHENAGQGSSIRQAQTIVASRIRQQQQQLPPPVQQHNGRQPLYSVLL